MVANRTNGKDTKQEVRGIKERFGDVLDALGTNWATLLDRTPIHIPANPTPEDLTDLGARKELRRTQRGIRGWRSGSQYPVYVLEAPEGGFWVYWLFSRGGSVLLGLLWDGFPRQPPLEGLLRHLLRQGGVLPQELQNCLPPLAQLLSPEGVPAPCLLHHPRPEPHLEEVHHGVQALPEAEFRLHFPEGGSQRAFPGVPIPLSPEEATSKRRASPRLPFAPLSGGHWARTMWSPTTTVGSPSMNAMGKRTSRVLTGPGISGLSTPLM